ncbi:MAG: hypothetical protein ACM3QY_15310 [Candidatus Levyibacteriota bacterium]
MKTILLLSTLAAGILGAGCAPVAMTRSDAGTAATCDTRQMARVEYAAQRAYTDVHWVSCPLAKHPSG